MGLWQNSRENCIKINSVAYVLITVLLSSCLVQYIPWAGFREIPWPY
jgi:hypothetical protein